MENVRKKGLDILMVGLVDENAVQQLKEFAGKKITMMAIMRAMVVI